MTKQTKQREKGGEDTENVCHYEYFQSQVVPYGCNFVVRIDGNRFTKYCSKMERPFDVTFNEWMVKMCQFIMTETSGVVKAHTHSDEASFYFYDNADWFDRRLEKIDSLISGMASSKFTELSGDVVWFDSRVIVLPTIDDMDIYEQDRRLDAFRGCVNSYSYWKLRKSGLGKRQATKKLHGLSSKQKQELLFQEFGINVAKLPLWQRVGTFLRWEEYEKEGYNPIKKEKVLAIRRRITHDQTN